MFGLLTHSIEVSQISRHMSRLLRLNEDLTSYCWHMI